MSVIFLENLQRNAVYYFIKAKMCEIGRPWLGKRFALSWSTYVPYSIYMQLCIPNVDFSSFACIGTWINWLTAANFVKGF